jgi:hypothetical protein
MCTKTAGGGLATTGIADGDIVRMPNNAARVEYDSAGTRGLLVEGARTNSVLRSQELDNASWLKVSGVVAAPTVTANFAIAPDGTLTAERVQIPSVDASGTQWSSVAQAVVVTPGACSVYLKGNGTSGTTNLCAQAGTIVCSQCSYDSASWSRCTVVNTITSSNFYIGNMALAGYDVTARPAQDVLVWGAQCEAGSYVTSYIPTTTGSATRAAESAYVSLTSPSSTQSIAATRTGPTGAAGAQVFAITQTNGSGAYGIGVYVSGGTRSGLVGNAPSVLTVAGTHTSVSRAWASWDSTTFTVNYDGTQNTSTPGASITARNSLTIGMDTASGGSGQADGIISKICLDPSPTKCR